MSERPAGRGDGPEGGGTPPAGGKRPGPGLNASSGYTYLSYLIGGMVLYGGIGWLIGRWTHLPVLFPIGMLTGLGLAVAMIIFRVTRSGRQDPHG
jgi:ATP synthase protein I